MEEYAFSEEMMEVTPSAYLLILQTIFLCPHCVKIFDRPVTMIPCGKLSSSNWHQVIHIAKNASTKCMRVIIDHISAKFEIQVFNTRNVLNILTSNRCTPTTNFTVLLKNSKNGKKPPNLTWNGFLAFNPSFQRDSHSPMTDFKSSSWHEFCMVEWLYQITKPNWTASFDEIIGDPIVLTWQMK